MDLMRAGIEQPDLIVDISRLPLDRIDELPSGGLRIGALVRNSDLASDLRVRTQYPLLSQAVLAGASAQLRNMATVGGNLLQRTRCHYFYDRASACNKREIGSGCDAVGGFNRYHAILGTSGNCIATHPSDMCVALMALDATVELASESGLRHLAMADFHRPPGDTPHIDASIRRGELITAIELAALPVAAMSRYRKVRDRASYAFALVSVAAAINVREGCITGARLALGGVATTPWRAYKAERVLVGAPATDETFGRAAAAELASAIAQSMNGFKIELVHRTVVATLRQLVTDGGAA